MKKKYLAKLLSVALSAAMAFTSVVPSYAMEGAEPDAEEPSEVVEETTEEEASDPVDETEDEETEDSSGILDEDAVIDEGLEEEIGSLEDETYDLMADEYTITYVLRPGFAEGSVTPEAVSTEGGKLADIAAIPPAGTGYNAPTSWSLNTSGTAPVSTETVFTGPSNIYAVYTPYTFTLETVPVFFDDTSSEAGASNTTTISYAPDYFNEFEDAPEVAGYYFAGWYVDATCLPDEAINYNENAQNIMDETADGGTITLYAKYVDDPELLAMSIVFEDYETEANDVESKTFTYGDITTSNAVFTAFADGEEYSDVTWSVYKLKEDVAFKGTYEANVGAGGRWNTANLTKLSQDEINKYSSDYGLTFVPSGKTFTIKNDGPKKALAPTNLVIEIVDTGNNENSRKCEIELSVAGATLTPTPGSVNFGRAKMGYDVIAADADTDDYTNYVKAEEVTLKANSVVPDYAIDDLEYVWIGADAGAFDTVVKKNGTVYANYPETITIRPKSGLTNKGDKEGNNGDGTDPDEDGPLVGVEWDGTEAGKASVTGTSAEAGDGIYEATLYAKSKATTTAFEVCTVAFEVKSNLKIASAVAHGGQAAEIAPLTALTVDGSFTTAANIAKYDLMDNDGDPALVGATTVYVPTYDLGMVKKGETFTDTLITVTGGTGTISLESITAPNTAITDTDIKLPSGIIGTKTEQSGTATYRISGKATSASALGEYMILLAATDNDGNCSGAYAFTFDLVSSDLALSIGGEAMAIGATDNKYNWYAVKNYTADNASATLTITNKSEDAVSVTPSLAGAGAEKFSITPATAITVPSGESKTVTITPQTSTLLTSATTATLNLSGESIENTAIILTFTPNTQGINITNPASTDTEPRTAYVGKAYSLAVGATTDNTVKSVSWEISKVEYDKHAGEAASYTPATSTTDISKALNDYGFAINKTTGVITGTPKLATVYDDGGDPKPLKISVKATATLVAGGTETDTRVINFVILGSEDQFVLTANGSVVDDDKNIIDLGTIPVDQISTLSQNFTVKNNTILDINKVKVSVAGTTKDGESNAAYNNYFGFVFDENPVLDAEYAEGFELKAGKTRTIEFTSGNFPIASTSKGTYLIPICVEDLASGGEAWFAIKVKVTDAPIISDTNTITGYTVGTEIKENTSTKKYTVSLGGINKTSEYNFTWDAVVPGLSLNTAGVVYGKPTKAGIYEFTVTATKKTDSSVVGTLKTGIIVDGSSTIALKYDDKNYTVEDGDVILLPGMVVGDTVGVEKATINVQATDEAAEGVTITVEDAEDDRTSAADISESAANPFSGSSNVIGVNKTSFNKILPAGTENFSIVTKSSPAPGVYKVKITIKSTNADERVIYAIMAVVDKFAITQPNAVSTKVGDSIAAKTAVISTTGGADRQVITWSEEGQKVTESGTETTKYYVTANGTAGGISTVTGLSLSAADRIISGKATSGAPDILVETPEHFYGSKTDVQATSVLKSGSFTATIKAEIAGADYASTNADAMSLIIKRSNENLVSLPAGKYAFPAQKAEAVTLTITSGKSDKVVITDATNSNSVGEKDGLKNGDKYVTVTGFNYNSVPAKYSNTNLGVDVKVENKMVGISAEMTAAFSANSNFELVGTTEKTVTAGGFTTFTIRPKSNLAKGTYTDKLTISGNQFETVEFNVSFAVEDASYLVDIWRVVDDEEVVYVENNEKTATTLELAGYTAGDSPTYTGATLSVTNVGNTALSNVSVYEVKDEKGTKFADNAPDRLLNVGAIATAISSDATATFSVTAKQKVAGVYTAYVDLHYTEGATGEARDVVMPVKYTVYTNDITAFTVTPADEDITLTATEGYKFDDTTIKLTVVNNGTATQDIIKNLEATLSAGTGANNFETDKAEDLAAGASKVITIKPKKALSEGTYNFTVTVSGDNTKTSAAVTKNVTFKVTAATSYRVNAVYSNGVTTWANISDAGYATGLYNSLKGLATRGSRPRVTFNTVTESTIDTQVVDIDFDGTGDDITIFFRGDGSGTALTRVDSAEPGIPSSFTVSAPTQTVTLNADELAEAKKGIGYVASATDAKCYGTLYFDFYGEVKFGSSALTFTKATADYANDNVVVTGTDNSDKKLNGNIFAYVPFGSTLGSVFTDGALPVATADTKYMNAWVDSDGNVIDKNEVVYTKFVVNPRYHTHTYAAANVTDPRYVKWIFTKDAKGNRTAELHLYCTRSDCPDHDGSELVVTDHMTAADFAKLPGGAEKATAVTYDYRTSEPADCEHGVHYEYPVSAKVNDVIYEGADIEDEAGEPLGHKYDITTDAVITWTDENEDGLMTAGEVKVTRTCTRCGKVLELTGVVIGEKDKVEPTCTKDGSVLYTITYTDVDEKGAAASSVTKDYKEVTVLKAKGHATELLTEVTDFDELTLTAAKLTLTCPDCNEVLFEQTNVKFTDNGDGTYGYKALIESTGAYYTVTYTNHAHIWEGVWAWTADYSQATLTLTCTQGTKPEVRKFTVDSVVTQKGAEYTYTVSKTYTWTEKGEAKTAEFSDTKIVVKDSDGKTIDDVVPVAEGIYIEGLDEAYWYTGNKIQPTFYVIDAREDLTYLVKGVDYTVTYKNNVKKSPKNSAGEYTPSAEVIVKGKGNYKDQAISQMFAIVDPTSVVEEDAAALKGASIKLPKEDHFYNGEAQYPSSIELKVKGGSYVKYALEDGYNDDVPGFITYSNNVNKGTATIAITGSDGTTIKKTFTIKPCDITKAETEVVVDPETNAWAVKGATPSVGVTVNGIELFAGEDFTVKYVNNKKHGDGATVTVTGKNNYKGALKGLETEKFKVEQLELADEMIRSVTAYGDVKASAVKATVLDPYGDVIKAGNYTVAVYAAGSETPLGKSDKLKAGESYTVVVTAKPDKDITGSAAFDVVAAGNLAKAKVTVAKGFEKTYTGAYIYLDSEDFYSADNTSGGITVTMKSGSSTVTLVEGEDFVVSGHTNNLKKGNMTVTLTGIGSYSGTKTFKVKIVAKSLK